MSAPEWISDLAEQERERRSRRAIALEAINEFRALFSEQIESDLEAYFKEFPDEYENIALGQDRPFSYVERMKCDDCKYDFLCQARTKISVDSMTVYCEFSHRPNLNRPFSIIIDDNGRMRLAEGSIADLSRYLLSPVLFDRLIPDAPSPSEPE
jgi:hypothetical protein